MVTIKLSAAGVKKAASRLREFLASAGVSLKQTHAYEALAQALGYANWNTHVRGPDRRFEATMADAYTDESTPGEVRFVAVSPRRYKRLGP